MTDKWKDGPLKALEAMTAEDIAALESRFEADPNSLSNDEHIRLLFHKTRAQIKEIERRALKKLSPDDSA